MVVTFTKKGLIDDAGFLIDDIAFNLNNEVLVDPGVVLHDIFNYIEKNQNIIETIFKSFSSGVSLSSFLREIKKEKHHIAPINFINFNWTCDIWQYSDQESENKTDYIDYPLVSGVDKDDNYYSISLMPLSELKDCPVFIDTKYEIFKIKNGKNADKILSSNKYFTLYEFLGCLIQSITLYGDVVDRENSVKEITHIENKIDNPSQNEVKENAETILNFLEEELERLVEEEKFEKAQQVKEQIQQIKNKQ